MVNDILLPSSFGDSYPDSVTGKWSPDGSYFAILRKLWQYPPDSYSEYALEIYDSYGNTVGLYEDVTSLNWALDGSYRILYSDYKNENTPCILNIIEKNTHCINEFIEWRNAQNVNTESYTWSPDGNELAFIYWDMQLGGLCTFNIPTTMVTCPTDDWITSESPEMFVREYSKSPDGQYYSIFVDPYGAMGHDLSYIKIGIVSADGRDFEVFDIIYAHNASWRPMLTP